MKISRRKFIGLVALLSGGGALADAFWFERSFIRWREHRLPGRDADWGISLLQISDLHLKRVAPPLRRLAKRISEERPDLICFTGDSLESPDIGLLENFLSLLDDSIPKVAILGNWEYWGGVDIGGLEKAYKNHNCQLLINQSTNYQLKGKRITVTGTDDLLGGSPDYAAAETHSAEADFHLVLNHCPQYNDDILRLHKHDIDLILSGHTHGGQINLLGWAPAKPPGSGRFLSGWYTDGGTPIYVSKGIGTSVLPLRFGARAEVSLFRL